MASRLFPVVARPHRLDVIYFTSLQATGPPAWLVLPLVFVVVALVLAGPAEIVGRCFADLHAADGVPLGPGRLAGRHQRLHGAVVPVGAAGRVGRASWPLAFVLLVPNLKRVLAIAAGAALVGVLLVETMAAGTSWSPYYKITTEDRRPATRLTSTSRSTASRTS